MSLKTRMLTAAATVLTAAALVGTAAGPAVAGTAQPAAVHIDGWQRVVTQPFTSPAGDLCPFALHSEPLVDQVYVRTTATFPDGSPQRQQYAGPLIVRLTNADTGASIVRNLSGAAVVTYAADGSYDFRMIGPAAVGFRAYQGDNLPTGFYVLRGIHVVHFAADGTRTLTVDGGTEENVCVTLA
jgi:hypothetical protein